jgi:hypothetical protein
MKRKLFQVMSVLIVLSMMMPIGLKSATGTKLQGDPAPMQPDDPQQPGLDNPIYLPILAVEAMQIYNISGKVTDENDNPLSGVKIKSDAGHTAYTDADGKYILSGFSEGLYGLSVESSSYYCSPMTITINVPPNTTQRNFTCSTDLVTVRGIVTDSNGDPVGNVIVTDNAGRETITLADGSYSLDLPAGIHTLTPTSPDYQFKPSAFTVRVGSTKVRTPDDASYNFTALASIWVPTATGANTVLQAPPNYPSMTDRNMAVDKIGNVHIVFDTGGASGTNTLYYGYYNGVAWTFSQVDNRAGVGQYASIALDSKNRPHIAYYDSVNKDLLYARGSKDPSNMTWELDVADSNGNVGKTTSIAIDSEDLAHIAYLNDDDDSLQYAFQLAPNGGFTVETIDDVSGFLDEYPSLALDSTDTPHVSFYRVGYPSISTEASVNYATRLGDDNWTSSTLATGLLAAQVFDQIRRSPLDIREILSGVGLFNSLAIDSYDNAHIAYYNDDNDNLEYAYGGPGWWSFETVDSFESVGGFASLSLDAQDRPQISYARQSELTGSFGGALKYAIKLGDHWRTMYVDMIGAFPPDVSSGRTSTTIVVDAANNPHILYYDFSTGDLKYAVRNKWDIQVVGLVGTLMEPSNRNVTLDSLGLPHIAFGGDSLYHGYFDGSMWQFELVDPSATAGAFASIDIDEKDNISIAYYDSANGGELKYARFSVKDAAWTIETVDSNGDVGKFASLILDYQDRPNIAYFDETNDNLKYALKSGSSWHIETVDNNNAVGAYPSIAIDSNNRPRIAYTNFTEDVLLYTYKQNGEWLDNPIEVPTGGRVRSFISLTIDRNNRPHISYFEDSASGEQNDNLKYAYYDGHYWLIDTIDNQYSVGWWNSMRLASTGVNKVSYYDLTTGKLKYASGDLNNWAVEYVDEMGKPPTGTPLTQVGGYTSLALDGADRPNIVYYDITNNVLKFAKINAWEIQTAATAGVLQEPGRPNLDVDTPGRPHITFGNGTLNYVYNNGFEWFPNATLDTNPNVGGYSSIGVNKYGNNIYPYIAYYDATNQDLKYTRMTSSGWTAIPYVIDTADDVGKFASLAITQVGSDITVHVAYFDETNDNLKYAKFAENGNAIRIEVVDDVGAVGSYPSLAIDSNGVPHISYYDIKNDNLLYAYRIGNDQWHTEVVDSTGKVGLFSSLALDSHNNPHIAYFDDDNDNLRYTYYDGSQWNYDVVDTVNSTGWYASLGLDQDNHPHITYYDYTNQNLKHAFWYESNFVTEIVDLAGDVGQYSSLRVDPSGGLHIAYYDATLGVIKYARSADR